MDKVTETKWMVVALAVICIGAIAFALGCGYAAYRQAQSPTVELYKNEWTCTKKENRFRATICTEYQRIAN